VKSADSSQSPCTDVCRVDERSRLCLGCGRTLDEIAAWSTMPEAQRRAVLDALPARRQALQADKTSGAGP
jgi:uncharacterized protein